MEQYMGNVFWAPSNRTYAGDVAEMKALGINVVRLPLSHQTLDPNDPQGRDPNLKNNQTVRIANSRLALETVIKTLNDAGIYVLLDIHSCSNYVDWRKGRLGLPRRVGRFHLGHVLGHHLMDPEVRI